MWPQVMGWELGQVPDSLVCRSLELGELVAAPRSCSPCSLRAQGQWGAESSPSEHTAILFRPRQRTWLGLFSSGNVVDL